MRSRRGGFLLIIVGCCCVLAAAALYVYNSRVSAQAAEEAADLAALLDQAMRQGVLLLEGKHRGTSLYARPVHYRESDDRPRRRQKVWYFQIHRT